MKSMLGDWHPPLFIGSQRTLVGRASLMRSSTPGGSITSCEREEGRGMSDGGCYTTGSACLERNNLAHRTDPFVSARRARPVDLRA